MAKPRRTHVPIHIIGESPQGDHFLRLWQAALGTDTLRYRALERLKDGSHLFLLDAPAAWAVLVDRREEARGPDWLHRYAILFEPSWSPVTWQVELTAYRWDPWLQADVTGDATVRESPAAQRRRVTDALRAEGGSRQDRLILRILPFDRPARRVAGVPRDVIDRVLAKHGLRGGDVTDLGVDPSDREDAA